MRKHASARGFTLIELLVVIGIIALMAAFLFSAFFLARKRSTDTICLSHLRQIGLALNMYKQDFEDYPDYNAFFPKSLEKIHPTYLRDFRVLKCPNMPDDGPGPDRTDYGYFYKMLPPKQPVGEDPGPHLLTWEEAYELRGESLPLVSDTRHGVDLKNNPDDKGFMTSLVLRLDGSVSKSRPKHHRTSDGYMAHFWFDN